jgi:NADPH:quinone reductase-like Zn-dependent oxidoreductase
MGHGDWKDMFRGVQNNDLELVRYYIKKGIDLNYQHPEFLTSPLIESIRRNHLQMLTLLLENGATAHLKEVGSGKSPLKIAQNLGNTEASNMLKQYLSANEEDEPDKEEQSFFAKNLMKAVVCPRYGTPDVLSIKNVEKPTPKANQILVKIMASAVNTADVRVRGLAVEGFMKMLMRLVLGFRGPRKAILGTVFSGYVEQLGAKVKGFRLGDEVFGITGFKFGTNAEYVVVNEDSNVILKPHNASYEEAAAIVFGGQTAIYFLEKAQLANKTNPKILIIGASGSVGTAAIQIASYYKADITAVCSSAGAEVVKKLGVDHIIFYDKDDFTKCATKFEVVFDAVGKTTAKQCQALLAKGGVYKTVGGWEYASETKQQLILLKELFEKGRYNAVIDKIFTMEKIIEAHQYVETGRKKGNVVLQIHKM